MADNVVANPGSLGATFATDDIGGVHYPISKLAHGALDAATIVSTSSGLPVQQQGTWTVDTELTTADLDTGAGTDTRAVVGMVLAESGGGVLVGSANPVPANISKVGGTAVDTNSGNKSAGTIRVVIATDQPALSNSLLVDTELTTADLDTGAGTDTRAVVGLVRAESGGAVLVGSANPLPVDTELSAAVALGDTDSNPTTAQVGACIQIFNGTNWARLQTGAGDGAGSGQKMPGTQFAFNGTNFDRLRTIGVGDGYAGTGILAIGGMVYNGSAWDRPRGDATNGLDVDVTRVSGSVTVVNSGTFAVQATLAAGATNIAKAEDAASADADVGVPAMAVRKATPANTSGTDGDYEMLQMSAGRLWTSAVVDTALPAGSNTIGAVNPKPTVSGGLSISRTISAASTNATSVKASAGQVYSIYASNINAAVRYLKLYNKASSPTVGTDVPVLTLAIPGNTAAAGFVLDTGGMGIAFGTGIALALTTGVGDADATAVAANEIVVNMLYA